MRKINDSTEIKPKKKKAGRRCTEIKKEVEKDWRCVGVVWLWDYSYRAAEELMRCVIRQI